MQEWPQVGLELWAAAANVYGSYALQTEVLLNSATAVLKLHLVMSYSESSRRYTHTRRSLKGSVRSPGSHGSGWVQLSLSLMVSHSSKMAGAAL